MKLLLWAKDQYIGEFFVIFKETKRVQNEMRKNSPKTATRGLYDLNQSKNIGNFVFRNLTGSALNLSNEEPSKIDRTEPPEEFSPAC